MKTILLDIDGVLNTHQSYNIAKRMPGYDLKAPSWDHLMALLSPERVVMIDEIAQATGAIIILSSTWRHPAAIGGHDAAALLAAAGLRTPISGDTGPDDYDRHDYRGLEIYRYITTNNIGPKDYIILDDDSFAGTIIHSKLGHRGRWIRTSNKDGLTTKHRDNAIAALKGAE